MLQAPFVNKYLHCTNASQISILFCHDKFRYLFCHDQQQANYIDYVILPN